MPEYQRCPVCEGRGTVPVGFYHSDNWTPREMEPVQCRKCDGAMVIERPPLAAHNRAESKLARIFMPPLYRSKYPKNQGQEPEGTE